MLYYLKMHDGDPRHSSDRGVHAITSFLHTNYPATRAVLDLCFQKGWVDREPVRGNIHPESTLKKRNPYLYWIKPDGERQLAILDQAIGPMYFERMERLKRRVG